MSEWYEPKGDDIDIDTNNDEVDIFVTQNDFGNVYITLTFEQIEEIHQRIIGDKQKETL